MKTITIRLITLLCALSFSGVALAHTGLETSSGLMSGVLHPLTGIDHLAFMLVVGLWAARGSNKQKWIPLMVLPIFMLIGAVCVYAGIGFAGIEVSIALSVMIMGLFILRGMNVQTGSVAVIAFFALFHGQAHMLEISVIASPLLYSLGFLLTSCSLLMAGLGLGQCLHNIHSEWMLRGTGLITGGFGTFLLLSAS
jgi:urease accessory protein